MIAEVPYNICVYFILFFIVLMVHVDIERTGLPGGLLTSTIGGLGSLACFVLMGMIWYKFSWYTPILLCLVGYIFYFVSSLFGMIFAKLSLYFGLVLLPSLGILIFLELWK